MNKILLFLLLFSSSLIAQETKPTMSGSVSKVATVDISKDTTIDIDPKLQKIKEMPNPASDFGNKKEELMKKKQEYLKKVKLVQKKSQVENTPPIELLKGFNGNNPSGTPNDNSIAISDSGFIVSAVNTNMVVYNDTGKQLLFRSLTAFASSMNIVGGTSDPRVIFDPNAKKFIFLFFAGALSTTNRIIVAFSKYQNPTLGWNFYELEGNSYNDTTWSDYPIISLSKDDFFVTFNHVQDNISWKTGFRHSAIWQIDKNSGFNGDSLKFNYWGKVATATHRVRSICPVMKGNIPTDNKMYFLSVRPTDMENDTVFLHTISNSYISGNATLSTQVLKTDLKYMFPVDALQNDGQHLATNDARVLSAIEVNGQIFYGQNVTNPANFNASLYWGHIQNINTTPIVKGKLIAIDSLEIGYPSLAMIGNYEKDENIIINAGYVGSSKYAGVLALFRDRHNNISSPFIVKQGTGIVNALTDTLERWGDYTGIQRFYADPNQVVLSNYYGKGTNLQGCWVGKLILTDSTFSNISQNSKSPEISVFPNPTIDKINVVFSVEKSSKINISLYDIAGKSIKTILEDQYSGGTYNFSMNVNELSKGLYFLKIMLDEKVTKTEQFVVE